ncbi:MAG: hypothetical protein GY727_14720, partial [Gammaproteobacteria bacterium]|nr:hypothetical protein [Gammaproteobacteria bacterium]
MGHIGGDPSFDERTGQYRSPVPGGTPIKQIHPVDPRALNMPPPTQQGGTTTTIDPTGQTTIGGTVVPPQPQQHQQQFGLAGFEQAQQAGLLGGLSALGQGTGQALGTLQYGNQLAQQQLGQAQQVLGGDFSAQGATIDPNTGQQLINRGVDALSGDFSGRALGVDPRTGQQMFQQASQGVGAFSPAGLQAQGLQSALSGAQGQEAFNQALTN